MKIITVPPIGFSANTYLLINEKTNTAAVIDPGSVSDRLLDLLKNVNLSFILLTHGHYDHILGVSELKKLSDAKICIHKNDAQCLTDSRHSLSYKAQESVNADSLLEDGDIIALDDEILTVLHTPGHTKGSVCFVSESERFIFSGDTLFFEEVGRTDLPGGSYDELLMSLKKIIALEGDYFVLPGHEGSTTLDHERLYNKYIQTVI